MTLWRPRGSGQLAVEGGRLPPVSQGTSARSVDAVAQGVDPNCRPRWRSGNARNVDPSRSMSSAKAAGLFE